MGKTRDRYVVVGDGFTVEISGEEIPVGSILQGIVDATLGTGDSITVTRELG